MDFNWKAVSFAEFYFSPTSFKQPHVVIDEYEKFICDNPYKLKTDPSPNGPVVTGIWDVMTLGRKVYGFSADISRSIERATWDIIFPDQVQVP